MTGALNLSLRPLSSAMQSMAVKREGFISRYFRENIGISDGADLVGDSSINIPAGEDFEAEFYVSSKVGSVQRLCCSADFKHSIYLNSDGRPSIKFTDTTDVERYMTNNSYYLADANALCKLIVKRTGSTFSIGNFGNMSAQTFLNVGEFAIDMFQKRNDGSQRLVGILAEFKLWRGGDRITGQLTDWYKFNNPSSVYQRNHAVAQGVELYSDSFALPEFFSRSGNRITKTGSTSESIFIATVGLGKTYKLSFKKDSHTTGSPNLRDQFNNQYVFPLMSVLEPVGELYEFKFTAISDGNVGINGNAAIWSISEISIEEFHGCEVVGGMPEDWFQVERQPHWKYWLDTENSFYPDKVVRYGAPEDAIVTVVDDSDIQIEFITTNGAWAGARMSGLIDSYKYTAFFNANAVAGDSGLHVRNIDAGDDDIVTGYNTIDFYPENSGATGNIIFRDVYHHNGDICVLSNVSIRRKLEIAQ
tara:strand:- start:32086 stop:33510 length:1425 start_codon:yes stop_codon:yes gene_type:complete